MDQVAEIITGLRAIAGGDSRSLIGWLKETRRQDESSLLGMLAKISLELVGKSDPEEKKKILSQTRCEFSKRVLEELLEMRSKNADPSQIIIRRFNEVMFGYAVIVEFPCQLKNQYYDDALERKFFRYFLELNLSPDKIINAPKEEAKSFKEFNSTICSAAQGVGQGILGELLIFCLMDKLGFPPRLSSVADDRRGIDLFVFFQQAKEQKIVEIQVKTDSFSPDCLITVGRQNQRPQIAINTSLALKDPQLIKELLSPSSPSQKSEEWREIITRSVEEVIKCRQK